MIPEGILSLRNYLSKKFIFGDGIEIGALHSPIEIYNGASVKYVDRFDANSLKLHYPEIRENEIIEPDIIDNGEVLQKFEDTSLDFIVANHLLEHCENPLGAIRQHLNCLKKGGVCFYTVPDKRFSFDSNREITQFQHLLDDDLNGPKISRMSHYEEWVEKVCMISYKDNGIEKFKWHEGLKGLISESKLNSMSVDQLKFFLHDMDYSIHFHVWDCDSFFEFIFRARYYLNESFNAKCFMLNQTEIIAVITKN